MTTAIIIIGVLVLLWFIPKLRKGMVNHDDFFTQLKFIQIYMNDATEKEFYNKDVEEAMLLGQAIIWDAAEDFNKRMQKAVVDGKPIQVGDMGMLLAAIRIVKAAEAMFHIKKNGPIIYENAKRDNKDEIVSKNE